jgi:hypothetical protein
MTDDARVVNRVETSPSPSTRGPDAQTLSDTYAYLLGRMLVIRQEKTDLAEAGVKYNAIKYNSLGSADFVNPNFDVAYLEAWVAVDDHPPAGEFSLYIRAYWPESELMEGQ